MSQIVKGNSIIALPTEYVCIDIETTGLEYQYDSIIEMSAAHVRDGQIVESFSELVHLDYPLPVFISDLTGITDDLLASAAPLDDVLPRFVDFCGDQLVVGHNVGFDVNFIAYNSAMFGTLFLNDYIDTLRIARKLFPDKQHHRLSEVAQYCGVGQKQQHRAEADVLTTIACYEQMRAIALNERTETEFIGLFKRHRHQIAVSAVMKDMQPRVTEFDDTHPFFGKRIVFTGALSRMQRKEAAQIVLDVGGIPADSLNKETNYLVIGNEDFVASVKNGKTQKMLKAEQMQKKGIDIQVISEDYFFGVIKDFSPELFPAGPEGSPAADPVAAAIREAVENYDFSRIHVEYKEIAPTVDQIDPKAPFFGKRIVFTGALERMSRQEACQIVANLGGQPCGSVTKGTAYLVVGDGPGSPYDIPGEPPRKVQAAQAWQAKGSAIQVITETAFFEMVDAYEGAK